MHGALGGDVREARRAILFSLSAHRSRSVGHAGRRGRTASVRVGWTIVRALRDDKRRACENAGIRFATTRRTGPKTVLVAPGRRRDRVDLGGKRCRAASESASSIHGRDRRPANDANGRRLRSARDSACIPNHDGQSLAAPGASGGIHEACGIAIRVRSASCRVRVIGPQAPRRLVGRSIVPPSLLRESCW